MTVILDTLQDVVDFVDLYSKIVKQMTPKQVKEIANDKTHTQHKALKDYCVFLNLFNSITKEEMKEFGATKLGSKELEELIENGIVGREEPMSTEWFATTDDKMCSRIWLNSFNQKEISEMLTNSAKSGDQETLKALLVGGVNPNTTDDQNFTPLFAAAENGQAEAVKILIESGSKVDHMTNTGDTPLHAAVLSGSIDTVEVLIHEGADQKIVNSENQTPLKVLKLAIKVGGKDFEGKDYTEIVSYLTRKLERAQKSIKAEPELVSM